MAANDYSATDKRKSGTGYLIEFGESVFISSFIMRNAVFWKVYLRGRPTVGKCNLQSMEGWCKFDAWEEHFNFQKWWMLSEGGGGLGFLRTLSKR